MLCVILHGRDALSADCYMALLLLCMSTFFCIEQMCAGKCAFRCFKHCQLMSLKTCMYIFYRFSDESQLMAVRLYGGNKTVATFWLMQPHSFDADVARFKTLIDL